MLKKFFFIVILFYNVMSSHAQKFAREEYNLRDTILTNYRSRTYLIDFILNVNKPNSNFKGLPNSPITFQVKQYPLNRLFSKADTTRSLNILMIGNRKEYTIVVDVDYDNDFSNNLVYTKNMLDSGITLFYYDDLFTEKRLIKIYPFDTLHKNGSDEEQKWQMTITSWPLHKYAVVKSGLSEKILFFSKISLFEQWEKKQSIVFLEDYDPVYNNIYFGENDSIYFSKHVFVLDSINSVGSKVFFKTTDRVKKCGNSIGDSLCYIDNIVTEERSLTFPNVKEKKFFVFHFWGSWCQPCLKDLPILEKVIEEYAEIAEFINVAYEPSKNLLPAKNIIKKYKKMAMNVLEFPDHSKFSNLLNIVEYPTYVIVSADGFYLKKITGEGNLKSLVVFLQNFKKVD